MIGRRHPAYYPYLCSSVISGFAVLLLAISEMLSGRVNIQWTFLASLTVATSLLAIKIPQIDSRISIEDTFFFTNLILFGPAAGTVTAALQGFMGSIRSHSTSRRLEFTFFNMGALSLSAYISGHIFFWLIGRGPLFSGPAVGLREMMFPMAMLAIVHYVLNSGSVAIIIAFDLRRSIYTIWRKNFGWTSVTYLTGASVAALIALNVKSFSPAVLVATAPIVLITYFTYKTYKEKIEAHIRELQELNALYMRTVESLALAIDAKDQTTHGHVRRVRSYALGLAKLRGITDANELLAIETGALLHDIGKLAIDDYILNKPGMLTFEEFKRVKLHAAAGEEILEQVRFPFPVAAYVRSHHERWDGTGYPDGLKGNAIPLGAQILTLADAFDTIRSPRPYKTDIDRQKAVDRLRADAGRQFDPDLVELLVRNIDRLEADAAAAVKEMPELSFRRNAVAVTRKAPQGLPGSSLSLDASIELISLCEFCSGFAQGLCLQDILLNLEMRVRRIFTFDACVLYLDGGHGVLRAAHAAGKYAEKLRDSCISLGKGISGWVAAYRRPMLNSDPKLECFEDIELVASLKDALVVPLLSSGSCLGTISLYAEAPASYSEQHLSLLQIVAAAAAPVIAQAQKQSEGVSEEDLFDAVTGCRRTKYLALAGAQLVASAQQSSTHFSLVRIDITNLDRLAEDHGRRFTDSLLRAAAETLRGEIREVDRLVRFGRASFVLLLTDVRRDQIGRRLSGMAGQITTPRDGNVPALTCRIGIATYPYDGASIPALLDAASATQIPDSIGATSSFPDDGEQQMALTIH